MNYQLINTCFITRDRKIISKISNNMSINTPSSCKECFDIIGSKTVFHYQEAFGDMFGVGFLSGNDYTNFSSINAAFKFLTNNDIVKQPSPKQIKIDELLAFNVFDNRKIKFTTSNADRLLCIGEHVNKEYSVLRYYKSSYDLKPCEISRLYFNKTEYIFCRKNANNEFVVLNHKLSRQIFETHDLILPSSIFNNTIFESFKEIIDEIPSHFKGIVLYTLIHYPDFAQMYKLGYKDICMSYIERSKRAIPHFKNMKYFKWGSSAFLFFITKNSHTVYK